MTERERIAREWIYQRAIEQLRDERERQAEAINERFAQTIWRDLQEREPETACTR